MFMALDKPRVVSRVPNSQDAYDKIVAEIQSTGCFFSFEGGRVTAMRTPQGLSSLTANTYRAIASALQFAATTRPVGSYTAEEFDTTGQYVASYDAKLTPTTWRKTKRKYLSILAAKTAPINAPANIAPEVESSEGDIELFPDGRPRSVRLIDSLALSGTQQPLHSKTTISLAAIADRPPKTPGTDWSALMASMRTTAADEPYGGGRSIESLDDARIGGMSFEQVVRRFEDLARQPDVNKLSPVNGASLDPELQARQEQMTAEQSRLFTALAAILRQQPRTVALAVQKIKANSPAASVLVSALGSASTAQSEGALIGLASSKATGEGVRNRALAALGRTPRPEPAAVNAFQDILRRDPFNEQALLGIGSYSRRLRDAGKTSEANALGELLVGRLTAADARSDRLTALRAIINSGYIGALPQLKAALGDADDDVRSAAVRALQAMHAAEIDSLIADRLLADPSGDVRVSALGAARVRQPTDTLTDAVENAATHAADPHVRYRAVELLLQWIPRRTGLRVVLEQIAKNDSESRIRERAQSAF
jgi:hypothetical protein